jgi:hypothetical protein
MKNSKTIISHLKKNPLFKKLDEHECYDTLVELLPKSVSRFIKFIYTKNDNLFFVLNHPAGKMELDYKIDLIKTLLKQIARVKPHCEKIKDKKIICFVSNKLELEQEKTEPSTFFYEEQSNAMFTNTVKNQELYELFEEIRKEIRCLKKL